MFESNGTTAHSCSVVASAATSTVHHYVATSVRTSLAEEDLGAEAAARAQRDTPVEPAVVSERTKRKADTKTTPEGFPVHSFPTLLADLANLVLNRVRLPTREQTAITIATEPSKLQRRAFDLLGVDPQQNVSITVTG